MKGIYSVPTKTPETELQKLFNSMLLQHILELRKILM